MVKKEYLKFILISLSILIVDFITKTLADIFKVEIRILPFFNLNYITNTGSLFGMFEGSIIFLIIASFIALIGIIYAFIKTEGYSLPLSVICGGILGNLVDRIFRGYVIDFLDFHIGNLHWPAFNIADSAIVIGIILLFYIMIRKDLSN